MQFMMSRGPMLKVKQNCAGRSNCKTIYKQI